MVNPLVVIGLACLVTAGCTQGVDETPLRDPAARHEHLHPHTHGPGIHHDHEHPEEGKYTHSHPHQHQPRSEP